MKTIIWQGIHFNTSEILSIEFLENKRLFKGHIIGEANGSPLHVSYDLLIDNTWNVQSISISSNTDTAFDIFMERKDNRWYDGNGKHYKELDDAIDIDISLTPFTNTLPINRLHLEKGIAQEITVLYFNLSKNEFRPLKQRYMNLGNGKYQYHNIETHYTSIIQTDVDGYVIDYPGIWFMVYPHNGQNSVKRRFADALFSTMPSEELMNVDSLYDWLVGCWDISVVDYLFDGTKLTSEGECIFSWALEGRAIQDLWIIPKRTLRSETISKTRNRYGTTLRIYNSSLGKWKIYWLNPVTGVSNELIASHIGNEIIQTGIDSSGNPMRWIFSNIKEDSFHWRGESSTDGGLTWKLNTEFFGIKQK
ncbi:MAG: putative glycolipid-binding domain-containing protein [Cyclobacteriaceae bacterium]